MLVNQITNKEILHPNIDRTTISPYLDVNIKVENSQNIGRKRKAQTQNLNFDEQSFYLSEQIELRVCLKINSQSHKERLNINTN